MPRLYCFLCFGLILLVPGNLYGQNWKSGISIPVEFPTGRLQNPWAGGLNAPQFLAIRLDQDTLTDLLVFDRVGQRLQAYLAYQQNGKLSYQHSPAWERLFPTPENWLGGYDVEEDGDIDLFTLAGPSILFFRNKRNALGDLSFAPAQGEVLQSLQSGVKGELFVNPEDIPALSDIDGDGDVDILVFDGAGIRVEYHQNQSQELYQHSDSLIFSLVESCFGQFTEDGTTNAVNLNVFCKTNEGRQQSGGLHAGSTLLAWDADGDQDKDLWLGDISFENLVFLENGGSPAFAQMSSQSSIFPDSIGVSLPTFPAAFWLDVDQDGLNDLLVSPHAKSQIEDVQNVWWYRNLGSESAPQYQLQQTDWLRESMLDMGTFARPLLYDYNQDGKPDLVVGNQHRFADGQQRAQLALFLNSGTADSAAFTLITDDWAGLFSANYQNGAFPALGDLDGDGDIDMMVGKADGKMDFYENISSSPTDAQPFMVLKTSSIQQLDVGEFALPFLWDWNQDSLLDLIVGEQAGNLNYFQNTGISTQPQFTLITDSLLDISVSDAASGLGFSTPAIYASGDTSTLMVGSQGGFLLRIQSTDGFQTNLPVDSLWLPQAGSMVAPAVGDLNQDGTYELILGNQGGGMRFYEQGEEMTVSLKENPDFGMDVLLYPNPTTGQLSISRNFPEMRWEQLTVFSLSGKVMTAFDLSAGEHTFTLSHLPSGMYLVRLTAHDSRVFFRKIQLISP